MVGLVEIMISSITCFAIKEEVEMAGDQETHNVCYFDGFEKDRFSCFSPISIHYLCLYMLSPHLEIVGSVRTLKTATYNI